MRESDAKDGDVIRTPNGNLFLVRFNERLGRDVQYYIGSADPERADDGYVEVLPHGRCELVGRLKL